MKPNTVLQIVAIVLTLMIGTLATIPPVLAMDSTLSLPPFPNNNDTINHPQYKTIEIAITKDNPIYEFTLIENTTGHGTYVPPGSIITYLNDGSATVQYATVRYPFSWWEQSFTGGTIIKHYVPITADTPEIPRCIECPNGVRVDYTTKIDNATIVYANRDSDAILLTIKPPRYLVSTHPPGGKCVFPFGVGPRIKTRFVTEKEWAFLSEAINASALSEADRARLIANLHIIYDDGGWMKDLLSLETQDKTKRVAFDIVRMYYHIDDPHYNGNGRHLLWNGKEGYNTEGTHNNLAEIAGRKVGLSDSYTHILNEHANDPDHWSGPYLSSSNHYSFSGASRECEKYADAARAEYKKGNFDEAYKNLAYAMHYMDDLANPWHTDGDWASLITHAVYEDYVESVFVDKFKQSLLDTPNYYGYYISSVSRSADQLAAQSHNNFKELKDDLAPCTLIYDWKTGMSTCTPRDLYDWKSDERAVRHVDSVTKALLTEALRYNEGLIDYVRRS